jgi:hypothetical protein
MKRLGVLFLAIIAIFLVAENKKKKNVPKES